MENKFILFTGKRDVKVSTLPLKGPGPNEVIIHTIYSGISSGTERWLLSGDFLGSNVDFPYASGYQAVGYIEKIGERVKNLREKDKVFVKSNLLFRDTNIQGWGCHSQYILSNQQSVFKLPESIDLLSCSMAELANIALNGVELVRVKEREKVVVLGLGILGQVFSQLCKTKGVIVIGVDGAELRLKIAKKCGVDYVVNRKKTEIKKAIENIWKDGANVVFETTSRPEIVFLAGDLLGRNGRIVFEGYYPGVYKVNIDRWHWYGGVTIYNPVGGIDINKVFRLILKNKVQIKPLITHIIPFNQAEKAYNILFESPEKSLGIVFDWRKDE